MAKKTAFIIHGTVGHPKENWFPWMKEQLEGRWVDEVIVPQFPTPEGQTLEAWFEVFDRYADRYNSDSILIGHSLGGSFLLRVLERRPVNVFASFIVAASAGVRPIKFWETDQPFIGEPFDWEKIRSRAGKSVVFHSDDDPLVSVGNGELVAKELHVPLNRLTNAGHFNEKAGYTQFPDLLEKIVGILDTR